MKSLVYNWEFTSSMNLSKAAAPFRSRLNTPACFSTLAKTLPTSFLSIQIKLIII